MIQHKKLPLELVFVLVVVSSVFSFSCKEKTKEKNQSQGFISVNSLIQKQVAHIDTSLYSIVKIEYTDSLQSDTTYIHRENFAAEAKEFLDIPDLSDPKVASRFKQIDMYDSLIRSVIITYIPIDPKKEEIKKQELIVSADMTEDGNNKVTNIIIQKSRADRNGYFGQQLLWRMDKSFLVTTTTQEPGKPEIVRVKKVTWNDEDFK